MSLKHPPARSHRRWSTMLFGLVLSSSWAIAAVPTEFLQQWRAEAQSAGSGTAEFSAQRGQRLFTTRATDWSCSSCHTADPRRQGQHATTSKAIQPMAPATNPARFSDAAKVEKWFRRNCRDVLGRECTALEKGDVLTWLLTLK